MPVGLSVLPEVPIRQWVCSLPWRLRFLCGYDRERSTGVLSAFVAELSRSLRARAKRELGLASVDEAHTAVVTFVQRFDSGLRLNVHLHSLALDGVYVHEGDGGPLVFLALGEPTHDEVAELTRRVAVRVATLLARLGRSLEPEMVRSRAGAPTAGRAARRATERRRPHLPPTQSSSSILR